MYRISLFIFCFLYVSYIYPHGEDFDLSFFQEEKISSDDKKNDPNISDLIDHESFIDDFVIETKKINIPGYPNAFNPSIAKWKGRWLLSFRIKKPKLQRNLIGLVWLDQDFNLDSKIYILQITKDRENKGVFEQDARLLALGDRLYVLYTNNSKNLKEVNDTYRMHVGEIEFDGVGFYTKFSKRIELFDNQNNSSIEKNWVPFNHNERLFLAYSLNPHQIYCCMLNGVCVTSDLTEAEINWPWGEMRGGTPALLEKDHYLGFFHSSKKIKNASSDKEYRYYFMGAYLFSKNPPFAIEKISPKPIIGPEFYSGTPSRIYPKRPRLKCIFPGGLVINENNIWVFYGRQDCEIWFVKIDKQKLLDSLIPTKTLFPEKLQ